MVIIHRKPYPWKPEYLVSVILQEGSSPYTYKRKNRKKNIRWTLTEFSATNTFHKKLMLSNSIYRNNKGRGYFTSHQNYYKSTKPTVSNLYCTRANFKKPNDNKIIFNWTNLSCLQLKIISVLTKEKYDTEQC